MTREEWLFARMLTADVRDAPPEEAFVYWRAAGWDEKRIEAEATKGWGRFSSVVSPMPVSFVRVREGDTLRVGARDWRVVIGSGHCPEHACLVEVSGGLMIAAAPVLPRTPSTLSPTLTEPEAHPPGAPRASTPAPNALATAT